MERPPRARSHSAAAFSLKSEKSYSSKNSKTKKEPLIETEAEKQKRELVSKANPNVAMNDAQPIAEALSAPTIGSLRAVQHVDSFGNAIAEPDLSNPTRPRWERPLDTIRSFEAAIDDGYKRRSPSALGSRPGTAMFSDSGVGYGSRRGSYFGGDHYQNQPRFGSQVGSNYGSYYGRQGAVDTGGYYGNGGYGNDARYGPGPGPRRPYDRRQQSEPIIRYNNNQNNNNGGSSAAPGAGPYPSPGYQRSRDTVNTGDSQSQSEPWTNYTDPSSENSSIDQIRAAPKHEHQPDQYASYNGGSFQQRPIREETRMGNGKQPMEHQQQQPSRPPPAYHHQQRNQAPPQQQDANPPIPPPHQRQQSDGGMRLPRQGGNRLMKLGSNGQNGSGGAPPPPVPMKDATNAKTKEQRPGNEKRQSWIKRRFSKKVQSSWFDD